MNGYTKTFEAIHRVGGVFGSRYQPWGRLRRRNLMSRLTHIAFMTLLGLGALGALAVMLVFASALAVLAVIGLGAATLVALFTRKPLRVTVRCKSDQAANGVFEAKKEGNTWVAYK
ncbi:hypothetical protein GCM10011273_13120 [Asticcacaulis endophyticus]|uniref:Uncharacterized protein n=2 Tax=Caulobacteraceae TaxID=76892 RepID=A0A918PZG1_9CAUL|nr:hypothetical protein GCM10011273_13120 [Asticcacaulis endophyticus]